MYNLLQMDHNYNNWEKPTNTGAISTPISALIDDN